MAQTPPSYIGSNIGNSDIGITMDRMVYGNNLDLNFSGIDVFTITANEFKIPSLPSATPTFSSMVFFDGASLAQGPIPYQSLSLSGNQLTITDGNTVNLGDVGLGPDFASMTALVQTSDVNDWNISLNANYCVDMTGNNILVGGIVAPPSGSSKFWMCNCDSGGGTIRLLHDTGGAAVNRFALPDEVNYIMHVNTCLIFSYNPLISRWMIISEGK